MDELLRYYKESCIANLCDEYKGLWRACGNDKKKLMNLVMQQQALAHFITFCNEGRGLSKQYVLENFSEYINGYVVKDADGVEGFDYMMYVGISDEEAVLRLSTGIFCSMWCNPMSLEIKQSMVPTIYCGCHSHLHITCGGFNYARISLFDDSVVTLDDVDEDSGITIFKYSDDCKVERGRFCLSNKVKEFRKELVL